MSLYLRTEETILGMSLSSLNALCGHLNENTDSIIHNSPTIYFKGCLIGKISSSIQKRIMLVGTTQRLSTGCVNDLKQKRENSLLKVSAKRARSDNERLAFKVSYKSQQYNSLVQLANFFQQKESANKAQPLK